MILMFVIVDVGVFVNYFKKFGSYVFFVVNIFGFMFLVWELYLEDVLEMIGYCVGWNLCYVLCKKLV